MTIEELLMEISGRLHEIANLLKSPQPISITENGTPLITVKQYADKFPWPTVQGMRWIIFNQKSFRAEHCFKKVGKRVLVDSEEFQKWMKTNPKFKIDVDEVVPPYRKKYL